MANQTNNPNVSKQEEDSYNSRTADEKKLNRIADEAAKRAGERERHFDQEHDIFTK